ncbi:MAG: TetR/AcrR family transcriptional regulator [Mycobacterium sp.]|nr:TetR/AcrR family transcriptional regulator [Mycobacterium sp.]
MRADAARNRARVLAVAYETFAAEGLGVPVDEIARRAGVGAGTVYRHFPAKQDLFRAVIADRMQQIVDEGRALLVSDPAGAIFSLMRAVVLDWGATDRGLVEAFSGAGVDINHAVPGAEAEFLAMMGDLLTAGQAAGTLRADVAVPEVKGLVVGLQAIQAYDAAVVDTALAVVFDGLRNDRFHGESS